jgi:hypothetical protein
MSDYAVVFVVFSVFVNVPVCVYCVCCPCTAGYVRWPVRVSYQYFFLLSAVTQGQYFKCRRFLTALSPGKGRRSSLNVRLGRSQSRSGHFGEQEISCLYRESNHQPIVSSLCRWGIPTSVCVKIIRGTHPEDTSLKQLVLCVVIWRSSSPCQRKKMRAPSFSVTETTQSPSSVQQHAHRGYF